MTGRPSNSAAYGGGVAVVTGAGAEVVADGGGIEGTPAPDGTRAWAGAEAVPVPTVTLPSTMPLGSSCAGNEDTSSTCAIVEWPVPAVKTDDEVLFVTHCANGQLEHAAQRDEDGLGESVEGTASSEPPQTHCCTTMLFTASDAASSEFIQRPKGATGVGKRWKKAAVSYTIGTMKRTYNTPTDDEGMALAVANTMREIASRVEEDAASSWSAAAYGRVSEGAQGVLGGHQVGKQ